MIHSISKIVCSLQQKDIFVISEFKKRVIFWNYTNNNVISDFITILDGGDQRLAISRGGKFIVCGNYYLGVAMYDINGAQLWINKKLKKIDAVKLSGADALFITTENKSYRLDIENGNILQEYSKINKIYSGDSESDIIMVSKGHFYLHDISLNKSIELISIDHDYPVLDVKIIEGNIYISKNNSTIECYSISTGKIKWEIQGPENSNYFYLGYDKNIDILFAILKNFREENKAIVLYQIEPEKGKIINSFTLDNSYEAAFSNNYKEIITSFGNVYSTFTGSLIKTFEFSNWWQNDIKIV